MPSDIEEYVPCYNYAMVCPGIYRSAHPTRKNFRFLRALNLKSICYLCPEEYPSDNTTFCADHNIRIFHFNLEENREPFSEVRRDIVDAVMRVVIDTRNHPILIHCERGRHRTGVICGCVRKLQGWSLGSIYSDYTLYNSGKGRLSDQQFLDLYEPIVKVELPYIPPWLLDEFSCGSGRSSLLRAQEMAYASRQGERSRQLTSMVYGPQVSWSSTKTFVGVHGRWGEHVPTPDEHSEDGKNSLTVGMTEEGLPCVSSERSKVTLILCKGSGPASSYSDQLKDTEPMVLAVRPQCSYVLAEHVADKGGVVEKDKKEKKDKSDKKEKKDKEGKKDKDEGASKVDTSSAIET